MLGQVGGVGKGLGAVRALVGLGLCVRLGVDLHLGLGEEGQRAYLTPAGKRLFLFEYESLIEEVVGV